MLQVGKIYKIHSTISEDKLGCLPIKKYIKAKLVKEYPHFYLFQTKYYKTTIHKQDYWRDYDLIKEI